jgi:hypothetical protein
MNTSARFRVVDLGYHPYACLYDCGTGKVLLYNSAGIGLTLHEFSMEMNMLNMQKSPESMDRMHYLIELFCYCSNLTYDN